MVFPERPIEYLEPVVAFVRCKRATNAPNDVDPENWIVANREILALKMALLQNTNDGECTKEVRC
jgi:hypothetical protein